MSAGKLYNLKVNSDARAARFVVDLKKAAAEPEAPAVKVSGTEKIESKLEAGLEKLAGVDYGEMVKERYDAWRGKFKGFLAHARNDMHKAAGMTKVRAETKRPDKPVYEQLAFVELGRFLFTLIYKICYAAGWIVVFILRLIYFILAAVFKPLTPVLNRWFISLHQAWMKLTKNLPTGLTGRQAVAITVAARLYANGKKLKQEKTANYYDDAPPVSFIRGVMKPLAVFAGVLLIIVLPVKAYTYYRTLDALKGRVLGVSENAVASLLAGGEAAGQLDFDRANQNFASAGQSFLAAQNSLAEVDGLILALAAVLPDKNLRLAAAGKNLLAAGELSAEAGKNLSLAMKEIFPQGQAVDLPRALAGIDTYGAAAAADLNRLSGLLKNIDAEILPADYQARFITLKQKAAALSSGLAESTALARDLENFLGMNADKRYLLIFQNNSELRASGGFIGSFAQIDLAKGQIKSVVAPAGGSYDTDAGLKLKIKAPEPLRLVRSDWHFWDANWWPDWPTTAAKLAWFYENSDGPTVDGVIGLTPTVMEKLLRLVGPIDMKEKYGLVFDADNFWLETQKLAEQKPNVTREPKKIIGDLMNKILNELPSRLNQNNLAGLLTLVQESLNDKNLLFYFTDPELSAKISELGWDGRIKPAGGDYLSVINTNIAGGKSDREIVQAIELKTEVRPDGSIIDELTVRRTHQGVKGGIFSGVRNVDWLRIYVPAGAELISAQGFKPVDKIFFKTAEANWQDDPDVAAAEKTAKTDALSGTKIYDELGKTVFANWSQVDPGQTAEIKLIYKLPFKFSAKPPAAANRSLDKLAAAAGQLMSAGGQPLYAYSLLAQKQPGMNTSTIKSTLKLNQDMKAVWHNGQTDAQTGGWIMQKNFNQDILTAALWQTD